MSQNTIQRPISSHTTIIVNTLGGRRSIEGQIKRSVDNSFKLCGEGVLEYSPCTIGLHHKYPLDTFKHSN